MYQGPYRPAVRSDYQPQPKPASRGIPGRLHPTRFVGWSALRFFADNAFKRRKKGLRWRRDRKGGLTAVDEMVMDKRESLPRAFREAYSIRLHPTKGWRFERLVRA